MMSLHSHRTTMLVAVTQPAPPLGRGDIVIDGGNPCHRDNIRRAAGLAASGPRFIDVGTSGCVAGDDRGDRLMIGGHSGMIAKLRPIVAALAPDVDTAARTRGCGGDVADPTLAACGGRVSDSGEGRWTIEAAVNEGVPTPVLSAGPHERFASRGGADFASQVVSAMRHEFGGHVETPAGGSA